jgi:adenylyltransferase/sulfurtransferase
MVGTMQANEVLKLILGIGEPLVGRLILVDALAMRVREWKVRRDPACPVCGDRPTQTTLIDYEAFCGLTPAGTVAEMSASELHARRQSNDAPFILDVRNPAEAEAASLGADLLIPLAELDQRIAELDAYRHRAIVVHCRSGARSARAAEQLVEAGFTNVANLSGGILAWSREVDPSVPAY